MLADHYAEIAPMKQRFKLEPDWQEYLDEQRDGRLLFITARSAGELVGYMGVFLRPHLHYRKTIVAVDDLHYLMPMYRGLGFGKHLIEFGETAARARGATVFSMRCKAEHNHGAIFEKLGYQLSDLVFIKDLTHENPA